MNFSPLVLARNSSARFSPRDYKSFPASCKSSYPRIDGAVHPGIAENKTAEISDWDFPKLRDVLKELQGEDVDFASMGFGEQDLRRLLIDEAEEAVSYTHLTLPTN